MSPPLLGADRAEFVALPPGPPAADGDDDASEARRSGWSARRRRQGAGGRPRAAAARVRGGVRRPALQPAELRVVVHDFPWVQVNGAGALPVDGLAAAAYKACYVYKEDIDSKGEPPEALWVPVPLESFLVRARRASDAAAAAPPSTALAHGDSIDATIPAGDWVWYRAPTTCTADGAPVAGCVAGAPLALSLEVDPAFDPAAVRYESVHLLLAHEPVIGEAISTTRARRAPTRAPASMVGRGGGVGTRRRLSQEGRPGSQPPRL